MSGAEPSWMEGAAEPLDLGECLVPSGRVIAEDHETQPVRRARAEQAARRLWALVQAGLQAVRRA